MSKNVKFCVLWFCSGFLGLWCSFNLSHNQYDTTVYKILTESVLAVFNFIVLIENYKRGIFIFHDLYSDLWLPQHNCVILVFFWPLTTNQFFYIATNQFFYIATGCICYLYLFFSLSSSYTLCAPYLHFLFNTEWTKYCTFSNQIPQFFLLLLFIYLFFNKWYEQKWQQKDIYYFMRYLILWKISDC